MGGAEAKDCIHPSKLCTSRSQRGLLFLVHVPAEALRVGPQLLRRREARAQRLAQLRVAVPPRGCREVTCEARQV